MNKELNLLYIKSTGHVIAAFTRSGEPTQPETAADAFVGDGFHLRGFGDVSEFYSQSDFNSADLMIPASEIGIFRTSFDSTVLNAPFDSQMINLDTTPALGTFSNAKPAPPATLPVTPAPTQSLKVTLAGSLSGPTNATFILISPSPAAPIVKSSLIQPPNPSLPNQQIDIPLPASLSVGEYYALIFLAGYPACVLPFQIN
ncbi:MAG TPA: hypothetical protein VKT53_14665 [Candidatus Acidoferrum sp.]|nr:hypothetical protein [Candidatus Acidoferrum sp.]